MAAMLETCGEIGYRNVAVQDVIDRSGGNRVQFYRHFASKDACYSEAHGREIELLGRRILDAVDAAPCWRLGIRAGLDELARAIEERPPAARGLLVEVHVAGGPALAARAELCERLAGAVDAGRDEGNGAGPSPPPVTAAFLIGAVEAAVAGALLSGRPRAFAAAVPELTHMIVSTYLGEDAAAEELAALSAA
jgi:AcrR family transcriptional regulator